MRKNEPAFLAAVNDSLKKLESTGEAQLSSTSGWARKAITTSAELQDGRSRAQPGSGTQRLKPARGKARHHDPQLWPRAIGPTSRMAAEWSCDHSSAHAGAWVLAFAGAIVLSWCAHPVCAPLNGLVATYVEIHQTSQCSCS